MASTLNWRGDDLKRRVLQQAAAGLTEFGLRCETGAKRRLRPSEQDASGDFVPGGPPLPKHPLPPERQY